MCKCVLARPRCSDDGVVAELMIQERVHAGLARASAEGKVLGRHPVGAEKEAEIRVCLLERGWGLIKTARTCGVGTSVVQRVRAALLSDGDLARARRALIATMTRSIPRSPSRGRARFVPWNDFRVSGKGTFLRWLRARDCW
jgi:hypothetical protein